MANSTKSLGETFRVARVTKELTLRDLAKLLDKTASYLSDIENDRRVPAEETLRQMAKILDLSFDELMAKAGRMGDHAERYLRQQPAAGMLFRRIAEARLPNEELAKFLAKVQKLDPGKGGSGKP